MSKTLTDLERVLKVEEELHGLLLRAADDKRDAIIKGDLPAMEELLQQEQKLIAEVRQAEADRETLVEHARREYGLGDGQLRMARIIAAVEEPYAARLAEIKQRLTGVLNKLRYRTRQNAELLHASVEHVNAFIRMVAEAGSTTALYRRDGKKEKGEMRLLDRSA